MSQVQSNVTPPPFTKKGFKAALDLFLSEQVPSLGGSLSRKPIVDYIAKMVDDYFPATERMKMGQMAWFAIDESEKAGYGKSLSKCHQRPVILDVIHETDIDDLLAGLTKKERSTKVAVRLFQQAHEQKGVLTHADVGAVMRISPSTVSKYIRTHEKSTGTLVPRRGTIHDMGPTLTHKRVICEKLLIEGKTVEQTARETNHSTAAVTRYANAFRRVQACLKSDLTLDQTSFATGLSQSLVQQYFDMLNGKDLPF